MWKGGGVCVNGSLIGICVEWWRWRCVCEWEFSRDLCGRVEVEVCV